MGGRNVARYFFILQWRERKHDDRHGTVLPNDDAARGYAERVIRELKEAGGYDDDELIMIVKDDARRTIFSIPFKSDHGLSVA